MSDIKFKSGEKDSPQKFVPLLAVAAGASLLSGIGSAISAGKQKRAAERKAKKAARETRRLRRMYSNLDTSNPFADIQNQFSGLQNQFSGMENTMEDLTVGQKAAQFQREQFQQTQANILGGLRESAGGSGIAALAQSLAQQGQIAAQRSSAGIERQELANQRAAAATAGRLQEMEAGAEERLRAQQAQAQQQIDYQAAVGERQTQEMNINKTATLLSMSQAEKAAHTQQAQQAQQAKWGAITGAIGSAGQMISGLGGGAGWGDGGFTWGQ